MFIERVILMHIKTLQLYCQTINDFEALSKQHMANPFLVCILPNYQIKYFLHVILERTLYL